MQTNSGAAEFPAPKTTSSEEGKKDVEEDDDEGKGAESGFEDQGTSAAPAAQAATAPTEKRTRAEPLFLGDDDEDDVRSAEDLDEVIDELPPTLKPFFLVCKPHKRSLFKRRAEEEVVPDVPLVTLPTADFMTLTMEEIQRKAPTAAEWTTLLSMVRRIPRLALRGRTGSLLPPAPQVLRSAKANHNTTHDAINNDRLLRQALDISIGVIAATDLLWAVLNNPLYGGGRLRDDASWTRQLGAWPSRRYHNSRPSGARIWLPMWARRHC